MLRRINRHATSSIGQLEVYKANFQLQLYRSRSITLRLHPASLTRIQGTKKDRYRKLYRVVYLTIITPPLTVVL